MLLLYTPDTVHVQRLATTAACTVTAEDQPSTLRGHACQEVAALTSMLPAPLHVLL